MAEDYEAGKDEYAPKEEQIKEIAEIVKPFYEVEQYRRGFVTALAGFLHRELAFQRYDCHEIMQKLAPGDTGNIKLVDEVYEKKMRDLPGVKALEEILLEITNGNSERVTQTIAKIRLFSKGKRRSPLDDAESMLSQLVTHELLDCVYAVISYHPLELIVAHKQTKQVMQAKVEDAFNKEGKKTQQEGIPLVKFGEIVFGAIPADIIKYDNPTRVETRYETVFESRNGKFKLGPGNIDELVAGLKDRTLVFRERQAQDALSTILNAYELAGKVTISKEIDTPGYYLIDGKICPVKTNQKKPTKEEIKACAQVVDKLAGYFDYKQDVFSTNIKWGVVSPFSHIMKILGSWLPGLCWYGWANSGKTVLGDINLAIWRQYRDLDHDKSFGGFDSEARFGEAISHDTYPVLVNEAAALAQERYNHIVELMKHAIEKRTARAKFKNRHTYTLIPALSAWTLTSNGIPPADMAFRRRHYLGIFTKDDADHVKAKDPKKFEKWFSSEAVPALGTLGDFASDYILTHPEKLLQHRHHSDWVKELGKEILVEFFKIADEGAQEKPMRQWIYFTLPDPQESMVEATDDLRLIIRGFLVDRINEAYRQYEKTSKESILLAPFKDRLDFVLTNTVVPFLNVVRVKGQDRIVITADIQQELIRRRIENPPNLQNLAAIMGMKYGKQWMGDGDEGSTSTKNQQRKTCYGEKERFLRFLEMPEEEAEEEDPDQAKLK